MSNLPNPLRAALSTFVFSFCTLFLLSALGWLNDLLSWATSQGVDPFPDVTVLGYAAAAALVSALIGLVNFGVRLGQEKTGVGTPPVYTGELPR